MSSVDLGRLGVFASVIARRPIRVLSTAPGELAWTDGANLYIDTSASESSQFAGIAVQASLLAAGSLEREVVEALARRPALVKRYLALEAQRALAAAEPRLPPSLCHLIDPAIAQRASSPAASLAEAGSRAPITQAPISFGTVRTKPLLAALRSAQTALVHGAARATSAQHALAELADAAVTDEEDAQLFENPTGGGGVIGKWLSKMLKSVRQLQGGGAPGADAPTHWSRSGARGRSSRTVELATSAVVEDAAPTSKRAAIRYPEWDMHAGHYRVDWCTVQTDALPAAANGTNVIVPNRVQLRRALARLGLGIQRVARHSQGDEIDIDALIAARVDALSGVAPEEAVFINNLRRKRDLSVLLLLDVSGSAAEPAQRGGSVHDVQRGAAASLMLALHELGDRVALYAYCSQGRSAVHVTPVKRFAEDPGQQVMQRLSNLKPGAYSRLGAAIRHGTAVLQDHGGTRRQLLVVLSDGLAYDHGYEPAYGAADARRALLEARREGVGCLCLSMGASTDTGALRRVFGSAAHATLQGPEQLSQSIGQLFRAAIRSADIRRRVS